MQRRPLRELLGVLISFKAVWILGFAAIFVAWQQKLNRDLLLVLACIGAGILMTLMGVDTARMMSFAFPGFLAAILILAQYLQQGTKSRVFNAVFALNLFIPSIYIGLVSSIAFTPGLYKIIYEPLLALITG